MLELLASAAPTASNTQLIHDNGINFEQIAALLAIAGAVWVAVKGLLAAIRKWVWRPNMEVIEAREKDLRKKEMTEAAQLAVQPLVNQLHPNGGSSFRDDVNRQFKDVFRRLDQVGEHLTRQDTRIDSVFTSLHDQGAAPRASDK